MPHSLEADLEKTLVSASKSFKAVHLRLLMKERDAVVKQFTDLDNEISAIENYFLGASSD